MDNDNVSWWANAVKAAAEGAGDGSTETDDPTADDIAGVSLGDFAAQRAELGLHNRGLFGEIRPDPRSHTSPKGIVEDREVSDYEIYAEKRKHGPGTSSILGCASPQPRSAASPYRVV